MDEKKPKAHKCDGCVWRCYTGSDIVFCLFPKCRREAYRRYTGKKRGAKRGAAEKNH